MKYFPARIGTEQVIPALGLIAIALLLVLPSEVIFAGADLLQTPHSEPCFFCGGTRSFLAFRGMELEEAYRLHTPLFFSLLALTTYSVWRSLTFLFDRRRHL